MSRITVVTPNILDHGLERTLRAVKAHIDALPGGDCEAGIPPLLDVPVTPSTGMVWENTLVIPKVPDTGAWVFYFETSDSVAAVLVSIPTDQSDIDTGTLADLQSVFPDLPLPTGLSYINTTGQIHRLTDGNAILIPEFKIDDHEPLLGQFFCSVANLSTDPEKHGFECQEPWGNIYKFISPNVGFYRRHALQTLLEQIASVQDTYQKSLAGMFEMILQRLETIEARLAKLPPAILTMNASNFDDLQSDIENVAVGTLVNIT